MEIVHPLAVYRYALLVGFYTNCIFGIIQLPVMVLFLDNSNNAGVAVYSSIIQDQALSEVILLFHLIQVEALLQIKD